jgi:hypothetical protein
VLEYVGNLSSEQTNTINWYCAGTNQDNILARMIIVWQASNAIYCCEQPCPMPDSCFAAHGWKKKISLASQIVQIAK